MKVLGVNPGVQAAAALSIDGRVVAAATEALFTREGAGAKDGWPRSAAAMCLRQAGLAPAELDRITVVPSSALQETTDRWPDASSVVPCASIAPLEADARQAIAGFTSERTLVCLGSPGAGEFAVFEQCGSAFSPVSDGLQAPLVESVQHLRQQTGIRRVAFGGISFSDPALAADVIRAFGSDAFMAPAPEPAGRAIGAALHNVPSHEEPVGTLSLGPSYSEQDVKATLDRCRLTYIYEPHWERLRDRVSRILSGGMLVAWFQGAAGFGSRTVAGRAVLCDASNRWVRENVNRFLRQVPSDEPLPLVAAVGKDSWHEGEIRRFTTQRLVVPAEWRSQVAGAIDRQNCVDVQGISKKDDVRLFELIRGHHGRTRVPALVAVPFSGAEEPPVCSPRDAIRTMFSSPIDVLVIERFVVAKDHWLLAAQTG